MSPILERLYLTVAGVTYPLAPVEHLGSIKAAVLDAVHSGGGFIDLTLDNGHHLSVLVTPTSDVIVTAESALVDPDESNEDTAGWSSDLPFEYDGDAPFDFI